MLVNALYLSLFLLSVLACFLLLDKVTNRRASYYIVLFVLITVVCLAYFAYSIALDTGMALVANQFSYFDGTFVIMFFMFCIMDICNIRVNKWIAIPMTLVGLFFLLTAFTSGFHTVFYESVQISHRYGASHLQMDLGPWYDYYIIYSVINMLIPIGIVITAFFKRKKISYKHTLALAILLVAIVALYFVEFSVGLGVDLLPCGYVLMEYVILGIIQHIDLYDVDQIGSYIDEVDREVGYIIFDRNRNYCGANETAKFYFPELELLDIDRPVSDEFIKSEFVNRFEFGNGESRGAKLYERKDCKIKCYFKLYRTGRSKTIKGYLVEIRDETQQQDFIDTLNHMNGELEDAVHEANNANLAKSQFLANVSHEIRTPINAILGIGAIAIRECENEQMLEYLNTIDNAGHNLLALINDILDLSKIEAGKIDIIEEEYDTAKLIKDVTELIRIKAEDKKLNFTVDVAADFPSKLKGDVNRIRQIMINILNNAVKYTPNGLVRMEVGCRPSAEGYILFDFSVRDSGIGIKEEDIGKLFNNFTRVDEARNKNIEGTGLGLAITKKLVDLMIGDISVESTYGVGSVFKVVIPQLLTDASPISNTWEKQKSLAEKKKIDSLDASGLEIMAVDDNAVNLMVVKGLLGPTKANITLCGSGREAIEKIKQHHYDIVFLDHLMPDMDGIETLHSIKELPEPYYINTVFIALTANAIEGVRQMFISEGFDDYISKPIDPKVLTDTVAKWSIGDGGNCSFSERFLNRSQL